MKWKIQKIYKTKKIPRKESNYSLSSAKKYQLLCAWYAICVRNWPRKHSVDIEELATEVSNNDYFISLTCDFQK